MLIYEHLRLRFPLDNFYFKKIILFSTITKSILIDYFKIFRSIVFLSLKRYYVYLLEANIFNIKF
jgi:hypothetical protein